MSAEELMTKDPSDLTEEEVAWLENESQLHFTFEKSIKLILNSIYGAFANEFFHFYNTDIAETITMQGQDAIKYTEQSTNKYFREFFAKDREVLDALGVPEGVEVFPPAKPVAVYADTDSLYISFQDVIKAVNWTGSAKDFVLKLNSVRLAGYFKRILQMYADRHGVENYLDFELETIADNAIFVTPKKYIQNITWKDGKDYSPLSYIKPTGLEIIQSSTPVFCRERLIEVMKFIFSKNLPSIENYAELIRLIKKMKKEFELSGVERISMTRSISDYAKFVVEDTTKLELASGCPIHVRAAAYHNLLLATNPKHKSRYQLVKSKDKIKWYHSVDPVCDVFAYKPGAYPAEFAPKMDVEKQFKMTVLEPLNRVLVPAGYQALDPSLAYTIGLF